MKTTNIQTGVKTYVDEKLAQKGLKLTQKNYIKKLYAKYADFIKKEKDLNTFKDLLEKFITASKGQTPNKVRNLFISITTPSLKKPNQEITVRTSEHKYGECILEKEIFSKTRLAHKLSILGDNERWNDQIEKEEKKRIKEEARKAKEKAAKAKARAKARKANKK